MSAISSGKHQSAPGYLLLHSVKTHGKQQEELLALQHELPQPAFTFTTSTVGDKTVGT